MAEKMSAVQLFQFTEQLTSKSPTPGGGGVAALIGALAAALGAMATNLSIGKKKLLPFEEDHRQILAETNILRLRFLELMDEDAAAFTPLAEAYSLDRSVPENAEILRRATLNACRAPLEMMQRCGELIVLLEDLRGKCSVLMLSDVGCGASAARAALESAAMNVFVNTRTLPEDQEASELAGQAAAILSEYGGRAQALADGILKDLMA